jgi:hypothetical protein
MKIGVCSLAIGEEYKKVVKPCGDSLKLYCEKWGYDLITDETNTDHDREYMWSKVPLLREQLGNYDYLVWIDGDIVIINYEIKLEGLIDLYMGNKDTMMSIDGGAQINTGFWVLKNTPYCHILLDMIYNLPELAGVFHEQGVYNSLYEKDLFDLKSHSRIIEYPGHRLFNATMYTYTLGDFLIHFLGIRVLEHLSIVTHHHYPHKLDSEDDGEYAFRMSWFNDKYRIDRYTATPSLKAKISVCTFFMGDKYADDVIEYGQRSMRDYCYNHSYKFKVERDYLVPDLPPHWTKIQVLLNLMNEDLSCDYVVWLDADIMIMNHDINIEDIIEQHMDGKDFLLSRDVSNEINNGSWIIRNTQYARDLLTLSLNLPELRYRGCEDQDTFNVIHSRNILNLQNNSVILPSCDQGIMNCCIGAYKWGDWLIHFFSLSKDGLKGAFESFYPYKKDDESVEMYQHRLEWIKNYG